MNHASKDISPPFISFYKNLMLVRLAWSPMFSKHYTCIICLHYIPTSSSKDDCPYDVNCLKILGTSSGMLCGEIAQGECKGQERHHS